MLNAHCALCLLPTSSLAAMNVYALVDLRLHDASRNQGSPPSCVVLYYAVVPCGSASSLAKSRNDDTDTSSGLRAETPCFGCVSVYPIERSAGLLVLPIEADLERQLCRTHQSVLPSFAFMQAARSLEHHFSLYGLPKCWRDRQTIPRACCMDAAVSTLQYA